MEHVQSDTHLATLCQPQPHPCSNDLIMKCFMNNFLEKKTYFTNMSALHSSASGFISLDHTFKIDTNVGYLTPDGGGFVNITQCCLF